MKGNVHLSIKTYKKSKEEYITIKQQIIVRLIEIGINYKEINYTNDRLTFNSLNILVSFKSKNPIEIISKFYPNQILCTYNNIYSFDYSDNNRILPFQINMINFQNLVMANFYYSYSIINNIINYISKSIGLYYDCIGLSVKIFEDVGLKNNKMKKDKQILLSDNPNEICSFFGLDYVEWQKGFETEKDIFKWLQQCIFFKSKLCKIDTESLQMISIKKRPLVNKFIEFIINSKNFSTYDEIVPYMNLKKTAIGYFNKIDTYIELTHTEK